MKIITSVLQLVPALLWQVGVSHLLQAAKGSTRRDSGIPEVRIHCGATGAVFPERGFRDPEVRAQQRARRSNLAQTGDHAEQITGGTETSRN